MIEGFGEVILSSLTIDSSGIATATSSNHGYNKIHTVILIAGADQEAANGEWRITEITDANTVKFDASESGLLSTTITGAEITMKVAPLGWSKPFVDVPNSVGVYQSLYSFSRRHFLRVDDSDNLAANGLGCTFFRGYEFMSSAIDDGIYPFPPKPSLTRGIILRKNYNSSAGNYFPSNGSDISWTLVGTANHFYLSTHQYIGNDNRYRDTMFFGDLNSYVPGDVGATGIWDQRTQQHKHYHIGPGYLNSYTGNFSPRNSRRTHTLAQQRWKVLNYPTFTSLSSSMTGWNHIVFQRMGNLKQIFINGVKSAEVTQSFDVSAYDDTVLIGAPTSVSSGSRYVGYIDGLRITRGIARYSADFTPPSTAFPTKFKSFANLQQMLFFSEPSLLSSTVKLIGSPQTIRPSGITEKGSCWFDGDDDTIQLSNRISNFNRRFHLGVLV